VNNDEMRAQAAERKARVWDYMKEVPPPPIREIAAREGSTARYIRCLVKRLEREHGITYRGWGLSYKAQLSDESYQLRSRLADHLYNLLEQAESRAEVAILIGLNNREQLRAINRPFTHDWTLSQIERLGQALGYRLGKLV
jgi:hypothetical protein